MIRRARWTWPDPQQYLEAFPRFARAFGGRAIEHGTANYHEGFRGVALWLPPGVAPDEASLVSVIQDTVAVAQRDAMFSMFEQMDAFHPREAHWHLPFIGVDPAHQGTGIGAALLRHVLNACDSQRFWHTWKPQARGTFPYISGTDLRHSVAFKWRIRPRLSP